MWYVLLDLTCHVARKCCDVVFHWRKILEIKNSNGYQMFPSTACKAAAFLGLHVIKHSESSRKGNNPRRRQKPNSSTTGRNLKQKIKWTDIDQEWIFSGFLKNSVWLCVREKERESESRGVLTAQPKAPFDFPLRDSCQIEFQNWTVKRCSPPPP